MATERRPENMVRITTPELAQAFIDEQVNKNFNGTITGHNIYFLGLCSECMNTIDSKVSSQTDNS